MSVSRGLDESSGRILFSTVGRHDGDDTIERFDDETRDGGMKAQS